MTEAEQAAGAKILVVDDDEPARELLQEILAAEGYAVDCASGGAEALEQANAENYDLVITDVRMADMDGLTLLQKLKTLSPAPQVILVTGWPSMDGALKSAREGAANYIVKPFQAGEVRDTVARTLEDPLD
jgi:DNA-binding NtrC family response regulator